MTYWLFFKNNTRVPYENIVKAREAAVASLVNKPVGSQKTVYANQKGKPAGIVYKDKGDKYRYGTKTKQYGWVSYALYKNGSLNR